MTADELVTISDLERLKEEMLDALRKIVHPENRILSFEEAVAHLKTTDRALRDRMSAGDIPFINDGKYKKFLREDLDAYVESRRVRMRT